jgi:hypothetical protein
LGLTPIRNRSFAPSRLARSAETLFHIFPIGRAVCPSLCFLTLNLRKNVDD